MKRAIFAVNCLTRVESGFERGGGAVMSPAGMSYSEQMARRPTGGTAFFFEALASFRPHLWTWPLSSLCAVSLAGCTVRVA
jgi:hypothetical protein